MQSVEHVRAALNWRIPVSDDQFDSIYPDAVRAMSSVHWTPVDVALRATALLAPEPGRRVLDVGSGAGKLCLIGALTRRSSWHGVEVSNSLVNVARRTAKRLAVEDRVTFHGGDHSAVDWKRYDSLYFYNPFELALFAASPIEPRPRWTLFGNDVARAEQCLSELAAGTRVVTYYGFGGELPTSYRLAHMERIGAGQLALWVKR